MTAAERDIHVIARALCMEWGFHIPVTLTYRPDEPYAVRFGVRDDTGWHEWQFARELLIIGTVMPAGIGDVRVRPESGQVLIRLTSDQFVDGQADHDESATLGLDRDVVRAFLDRTLALVPSGTESAHLDLDGGLSRLLASGQ